MFEQKPYFLVAVAAATAVIVYGSLYPFDFSDRGSLAAAMRGLVSTWRVVRWSRGDIIANLLLYMPFGFFGALSIVRLGGVARTALVTLAGFLLCGAIEIAQFYDAGRDSAMSDIYANTAGTLLGALAATTLGAGARLPFLGDLRRQPFALLLLACWVGYRYYPYVPTIDAHKYWDALKPLFHAPVLRGADLLRHTAIWLALAMILEALLPARPRLLFAAFLAGALALRILVLGIVLSPAETLGAGLALLLWVALLSRLRLRAGLLAAIFAAAVAVQALDPFTFAATARDFGWLPFRGFLSGSLQVNVISFFEKSFLYATLLWLLVEAGWRLRFALPLAAAFVFALRYAQTYLPARSAEIGDVLILLLMGGLLALLRQATPTGIAGAARRAAPASA